MLFYRYGQGETVLYMPLNDAIELVNYASMQRLEELLLKRWICNYEKEFSFAEFKQKLGIHDSKQEEKTLADILLKLKNVFG